MSGVRKYRPELEKSREPSFLHKWKRKSKNPYSRQCSEGSQEKINNTSKPTYNRSVSYSHSNDYEEVNVRNAYLLNDDVKITCRDFILAERYASLIESGNLDIFKDLQNSQLSYNNTFDTKFLLDSSNNTRKTKRVKTFGGHTKHNPNRNSLNKTKSLLRPMSGNVQVRKHVCACCLILHAVMSLFTSIFYLNV